MSMMKNAVESIQIGMVDFHDDDPRRVLSAIRNLYAGILLLFKCKLQELSPEGSQEALLKTDVIPVVDPKTGQATWIGKGKRTVEVRDVIDRLGSLGVSGVEWKRLNELQKIRNDIEHYYSQQPAERMNEAVTDALHLIVQFCEPHLGEAPAEILGQECWGQMLEVAAIYGAELKACRDNLSSVKWFFQEVADAVDDMRCPHCDSELIKAVDPTANGNTIEFICSACQETSPYSTVVTQALAESLRLSFRDVANGSESPLGTCPECGEDAFLIQHAQCAACFYELEHTECWRCGTSLSLDEHEFDGLCGYCNYIAEKIRDE